MSRETNFSNPKVYMKIDLTNEGSKGRVGDYAGNLCLPSLLKAWISQKTVFFSNVLQGVTGKTFIQHPFTERSDLPSMTLHITVPQRHTDHSNFAGKTNAAWLSTRGMLRHQDSASEHQDHSEDGHVLVKTLRHNQGWDSFHDLVNKNIKNEKLK